MRLRLLLRPISRFLLPRTYRSALQGLIYHRLSDSNPDYAAALHDEGYQAKGTTRAAFKFFAFSSLLGQGQIGREIMYDSRNQGFPCSPEGVCTLLLSSPDDDFFKTILQGMFEAYFDEGRPVEIARGLFAIEALDVEPTPAFVEGEAYDFRCIGGGFVAREAPGLLPDGRTYLTLEQKERFEAVLSKNLRMKMETFFVEGSYPTDPLAVTLLPRPDVPLARQSFGYRFRHGSKEQTVVGTPCDIRLQGPSSWLSMAYAAGVGEKNSQGMGMIELLSGGSEGL